MRLIMISLTGSLLFLALSVVGGSDRMSPAPELSAVVSKELVVSQRAPDARDARKAGRPHTVKLLVEGELLEDSPAPAADGAELPEQPPVQAPDVVELPEELLVRLPMDDYYYSQLTDTDRPNTCGPTALVMVLDYFGMENSLSAVIAKHQYPASQGGYDPYCSANPVCTSPGALVRVAVEEYGLSVDAREGWTFEDVSQSLAAGRPLIADIAWGMSDEGPGHFIVIFGVDPDLQTVSYHDPYYGSNKTASWDELSAAWDGPVDRGDPLQPQGHRYWAMGIGIE